MIFAEIFLVSRVLGPIYFFPFPSQLQRLIYVNEIIMNIILIMPWVISPGKT